MAAQFRNGEGRDWRAWFLSRVTVEKRGHASACWLWAGAINHGGYGTCGVGFGGACRLAHRLSHLVFRGPIPDGNHVDHLCFQRLCVNPDHLEAVTPQENVRRSLHNIRAARVKARKPYCGYGHPMEGDNIKIRADGARRCRACNTRRRITRPRIVEDEPCSDYDHPTERN